jgi:hypothetical protein
MLLPETAPITVLPMDDAHVQSSATAILEAAIAAGSGCAAVLGCGACAEIPIRPLAERFNPIDMVELDDVALKIAEVQCQQRKETQDTCIFHHADLTGLIPQVEPLARDIAARAAVPSACLDGFSQLLSSTAPNFWRSPQARAYKLVVCSAILTQLQATVRRRLENIFSKRFPSARSELSVYEPWRKSLWNFARRLEEAFIDHLESLSTPAAIVYLSDTVHVCWLLQSSLQTFTTEGAWIATRTSCLVDYLRPWNRIMAEHRWNWFRREQEGSYWGRLYGVQAIIYRVS